MTPMIPSSPAPTLFEVLQHVPDVLTREQLDNIAVSLPALVDPGATVDIGTKDMQAPGLYSRSVVLPAGSLTMGLPHKVGGMALIVGDLTMWSTGRRTRYRGAHMVVSEPGPRMVYAHTDTTFITVHANTTGGTDPSVIEDSIVERASELLTQKARAL